MSTDREIAPPTVEFSRIDSLRGLIDADGSIGLLPSARGVPFISLTTRSGAITDFFLGMCVDLPGRPLSSRRNRRDDALNPMAEREAAVDLAVRLYYEQCLALVRKADAAKQVLKWRRPAGMRISKRKSWTVADGSVVLK